MIDKSPFEFDEDEDLAELFESGEDMDDKENDIVLLSVSKIIPFKNHPFKVDDEQLDQLKNSIAENGILHPLIVRCVDDGFELISGHRRKRACELLGIKEVPCIIKELNDDMASVLMVDANIQRENILPSEKAKAYRIKYDALKHQGKQIEKLGNTAELVGKKAGDSGRTVQRYYRLSYLCPDLLNEVDEKKLTFNSAVILAGLDKEIQEMVLQYYNMEDGKLPSEKQARAIKNYLAEYNNNFSMEKLKEIMQEASTSKAAKKISVSKIERFFPRGTSMAEMERKIIELLEADANK
jgi:ParB family chromosome partitioning protein